jgi:hypothetical protein
MKKDALHIAALLLKRELYAKDAERGSENEWADKNRSRRCLYSCLSAPLEMRT